MLLKIAKNQFNKIKIKPTRNTQIINNFQEIINLLQAKESPEINQTALIREDNQVKSHQPTEEISFDLNEMRSMSDL